MQEWALQNFFGLIVAQKGSKELAKAHRGSLGSTIFIAKISHAHKKGTLELQRAKRGSPKTRTLEWNRKELGWIVRNWERIYRINWKWSVWPRGERSMGLNWFSEQKWATQKMLGLLGLKRAQLISEQKLWGSLKLKTLTMVHQRQSRGQFRASKGSPKIVGAIWGSNLFQSKNYPKQFFGVWNSFFFVDKSGT